ncbi:MAG TPA: 9-O-acetyl-N-acetylneuraminate esterase, partial [Lachnospiraceae bacterium]|nr:9-O-acetyl-N-acetylneuraminate esterase [Lachnospiraceae bacterium]
EAEKKLLGEKNTLFESIVNKLYDFPELKDIVYSILFMGKENSYNVLDQAVGTAEMFGFIKNMNGVIAIANRVFETVFYNLFLTSMENQNTDIYKAAVRDKNQFVYAGHLNMDLILEKFVLHFDELYGDRPERFKEEDGRRYFLLYLRPIINGTGNYYIESRTRNMERTDVIVDYRGEQMVIELKIWRGNAYHERGERQLIDYLDHYHL